MTDLDESVWTAHGDAWQAEGTLRARTGGGAAELPGVRLMASGLPFAKWNNGDVTDPARFPLDQVRAWYAERAGGVGVPWGVRVPAGWSFAHGRHLFRKRCMALRRADYAPSRRAAAVRVRAAEVADVEAVARIDAEAFADDLASCRTWVAPHLGAPGFTVALAELAGEPIGVATSIETDSRAGPSVGLFGVGVIESARRRGAATAMTAWLLERAFARGAELAHLNPDGEPAAGLYRQLGFCETAGLDVYADL